MSSFSFLSLTAIVLHFAFLRSSVSLVQFPLNDVIHVPSAGKNPPVNDEESNYGSRDPQRRQYFASAGTIWPQTGQTRWRSAGMTVGLVGGVGGGTTEAVSATRALPHPFSVMPSRRAPKRTWHFGITSAAWTCGVAAQRSCA